MFPWVTNVSGFLEIPKERITELVEFMVAKGILWSDNGILAFAPEGENTFGRRNFMDIFSVFTSPPLFKVMSGQKYRLPFFFFASIRSYRLCCIVEA